MGLKRSGLQNPFSYPSNFNLSDNSSIVRTSKCARFGCSPVSVVRLPSSSTILLIAIVQLQTSWIKYSWTPFLLRRAWQQINYDCRAWHLNWADTMKNRMSVLARTKAVCYNSGLTWWADKNILVYREKRELTLPKKVTIENVKCPKIYYNL